MDETPAIDPTAPAALLLPAGPFSVIYADPPWAWSKAPLKNRGRARTVEKEYSTLQLDDITALPVNSVAATDSVLFLWATGPKLPLALTVMAAWGFSYKTIGFTWVKENRKSPGLFMGMGFFTRANSELCLVGARGSLKRQNAGVRQVITAPVSEHSRKPTEARDRITRLYGDVPRLEMFARERVPGWTSWGDQVPDGADAGEDQPDLWQTDTDRGAHRE